MAVRRKPTSSAPAEIRKAKQEQNHLICYRYAQCRNASTVGKEFGVSRMYVTRAWARLSEEEQQALFDTSQEVSEELNRKILDAERIAGDDFTRKIIEARRLAADELLRRFTGSNIRMINDKNFTSLLRLVAGIQVNETTDNNTEKQDTLRQHRESIREEIENFKDTES